ncbi:MAG TPA: pectinesterase family protein [Verrucomicrobiae bacterium]|nr:pectinesterase family protein [Verrucomicrobiae bacterium]
MKTHLLPLAILPLLFASFFNASAATKILALQPLDGASNICPDTLLRLSFDSPSVLGRTGKIRITDTSGQLADTIDLAANDAHNAQPRNIGGLIFTNYPILISSNTALICPHAATLKYGQTYRISIDPDVFEGITNPTAWTIQTKRDGPAADAERLTVAADGSGDFCTVQGAVDFVPPGNTQPREIFIRNGIYQEIVCVTNKNHLTFHGEDRKQTIIQYANNENFNYLGLKRNAYRQTFGVDADDFHLENLTLHNTTPKHGKQAEALRVDGQRCVINNVDFYSFQDTLKLSGTVFINNCYIEGDVDFIWGYGTCYFTNCEIKSVTSGACITQIRNDGLRFGDVFVDCRLTKAAGVSNAILSRIEPNRFPYSHVAWINCVMDDHIRPYAWDLMRNTNSLATVRFWEYHTTDPAGKPLDASKRAGFSKQLTDAEAAQMRDAKYILGGWLPPAR